MCIRDRWDNEKDAISKVQQLRADLESANAELEKAQREYDLNKAAELQYGDVYKRQSLAWSVGMGSFFRRST